MKIRAKLFLLLLPPLLLSGLLINYLTGRAVCTTLHEETAASVAAGAARLLDSSSPDFLAPREDKLLPFLYNLKTSLNAEHACFVDAGGTILAHTDVIQKGRKLPGARSSRFISPEGGYDIAAHSARSFMEVYIPVNERRADSPEELALLGAAADAKRLGTLVVFSPLKGVIETENYIARKSAAILAVVYLAILFTVFFLASLALRPIRRLISGTERIRLGDYDTLLPVASRDEFGDLARSFNAMSKTLSSTIVSKDYLNTILDNMADTMLVIDLDGVIRKTNRAARALLGRGEKEFDGLRAGVIFPTENPDAGHWVKLLKKDGDLRNYETVVLNGSGARIPVLTSATLMRNAAGEATGIVSMIHDITLRKKYEAELARSNEDLQRFAFVASHDLQEPLKTISNYVQMLEAKYRKVMAPESEKHVEFITGAVGRMRALILGLLAYSKTNATLHLEDVNSEEALDYVLRALENTISASGAVIERGNLPVVRADRCHIESLFQNLISNAIKFRNGTAPHILVSAETGPGGWTFRIKDDGIGIEEVHAAKLFKLFGRLHGKAVDGAGIGLASCKRIVEYYGGNIWFKSEPDRGSSFFFSIPRQPG